MENEWAEAGRDSRLRLARLNFQARTGAGTNDVYRSVDLKQDWKLYPLDAQSAERDDQCQYSRAYLIGFAGAEALGLLCHVCFMGYLLYNEATPS